MKEFCWRRTIAGFDFKFSHRSKGGLGRFGGGWNWKVGFQAGATSILISLLVFELRISRSQ